MIIVDGRSLHLRTTSRIPSLAAGGDGLQFALGSGGALAIRILISKSVWGRKK